MGRLLCCGCGEAGDKEKESARGTMGRVGIVPRALSIFFDYFILMGIPSGSLWRREPFTLKLMILSLLELLHFLKQIISFVWFKISFRVSRQSIPSQSLLSSSLNNDRTLKMLLCLASVIFRPQIEIK